MPNELVTKAMAAMGWNVEAEIPMANEENMLLLNELDVFKEQLMQLKETRHEMQDRIKKLHQHTKNAEISINHNLKLLNAYQRDIETERNFLKVADRELSKLGGDIRNTNKEAETFNDYVNSTEKEMCKRKRNIQEMTNRINWAKTALIEWHEAMQDGNRGYLLIERFFADDRQKACEQDQRRQQLQNQIEECRKELIMVYDEQKTLEQNLECTANLYRNAHLERRQMVETWKIAVHQMIQRERDIHQGEIHLHDLQVQAKKQAGIQKGFDNRLNDIIGNNREVEGAIEELNNDTSDIKEQIQKFKDIIILKENEVELLQKDLQNLSNRVQQQRFENRQHEQEKAKVLEELENFEDILKKLEERLAKMESRNINAQQRLQLLEEMNDVEEKQNANVNKDTMRFNSLVYRAQMQLSKLKDERKVLLVANEGIKVSMQAVLRNSHNIEKELRRQTEVHYELAFKCLQTERRIIKIHGGVLDPEVEERNREYLSQLEDQNGKTMRRLQATEHQNKKLDDNMRKLTASYNDDNLKLEVIYFQIKEAQVYCEGGATRLKTKTHNNQLRIVELSLLKMRVNEFENEIDNCESSSYNLEKHRIHLNRKFKGRIVEIKSQMDLLNLKRKHLNEEKNTLRADIGERNKHIEAMRARFDLTSKLLGTNDDGTLVTSTQLKVELAQEKQILLDEGNALNDKVLNAEHDIKAMENTLLLLNNSNNAYRKNFQRTANEDELQNEYQNLHTNYCKTLSRLKSLRNKLLKMEQENEQSNKEKELLDKKLEVASRKRLENSEILGKLQKELLDQKMKIKRAEREMKLALKAVKQRPISSDFLAAYERELDLCELEYRNSKALNQLADVADNDDEIGPKIVRILADRGLKMPHLLQKTRSLGSWRSEMSDISCSSSKDVLNSTGRSSLSENSHFRIQTSSTSRVSVVSIDFKAPDIF